MKPDWYSKSDWDKDAPWHHWVSHWLHPDNVCREYFAECTKIQLHPDHSVRDPYGVITARTIHELERIAEGFAAGYASGQKIPADVPYDVVRDYVYGLIDVPYELACEVALWVTKDQIRGMTSHNWTWFRPIL